MAKETKEATTNTAPKGAESEAAPKGAKASRRAGMKTPILVAALLFVVACTPAQRAAVARTVADLAGEVCVEGDSVKACIRKCDAAASPQPDDR